MDVLNKEEGWYDEKGYCILHGTAYREIIETDPHGGFVGHIAELPGCITQAETKRDLLDQLDDAKLSWIEAALEDGVPIPDPLQEEDFSGRFNLRLPKSLHRNLALTARAEGVSLNQLATALIAGGLKNVTNTYEKSHDTA